jgi:formate C-acetyltransferase
VALELSKYKNTRYGRGPIGCVLHCSTSTVSSNTPVGKVCGATPDGRKAGAALADGQSPMRGTDVCGPTASIASVSKVNFVLLSCGSLYNLKFNPAALC